MASHPDALSHPMGNKALTVTEPYQLTLWPDDALPGQMPLFNRQADVGCLSEAAAQYCDRCEYVLVRHVPGNLCFRCEDLIAEFLTSRETRPKRSPPAAAPIWEPDEWFSKRPHRLLVPAAKSYL